MNDLIQNTNWALLDIETTGIDPKFDKIIDVGFLRFKGLELVEKYQSRVKYTGELSLFIQKLTGIKEEELQKAPDWSDVLVDLKVLKDHIIIAHNAKFEESFLGEDLKDLGVEFVDDLPFIASLFPDRKKLNLESFIEEFGIRKAEVHQGYEDALDMGRVLCHLNYQSCVHPIRSLMREELKRQIVPQNRGDRFWRDFLGLNKDQIEKLSLSMDHPIGFCLYQPSKDVFDSKDGTVPEFGKEGIEGFFKDQERWDKIFPGYSPRKPQIDMALRVGQSLKNKVHSVIEAPTGTGKTLGYLVPAIAYGRKEKEQILISTGTKNLQNQAMEKDIPLVKKLVDGERKVSAIKILGSKNYYCEARFKGDEDQESMNLGDWSEIYFNMIFFYNGLVEESRRINVLGHHRVLNFNLKTFSESLKKATADFRSCTGHKCPFKRSCSYFNTYEEAKKADVLVVNHSLLFHWPKSLDRPQSIIVDEAHHIEKQATESLSLRISSSEYNLLIETISSPRRIASLRYLMGKKSLPVWNPQKIEEIVKLQTEIKRVSEIIPDDIEFLFKSQTDFSSEYWNEKRKSVLDESQVGMNISSKLFDLCKMVEKLYKIIESQHEVLSSYEFKEEDEVQAWNRVLSFFFSIEDLKGSLLRYLGDDSNDVQSLRFHGEQGFEILVAPIDISLLVKESLLDSTQSTIFTSATLGVGDGYIGEDLINWFTGIVHLKPEKRFAHPLVLETEFNYKDQARVTLDTNIAHLSSSDYVPTIVNFLLKKEKDSEGGSLFLLSSRKRFDQARELLLSSYPDQKNLYFQGMGPHVLDEFKKNKKGLLVGMESMGEGIDLPGECLRTVYIDKVPDLRFSELINARREYIQRTYGNEFENYYLPHRINSLKQKLGRLIRSKEDYGEIFVFDGRLKRWRARTKSLFLRLLKPYHVEIL